MKPITSPLTSGDRDGAVGNLQDALLLLLEKRIIQPSPGAPPLAQLLRNEQQQGPIYGHGTSQTITLFQDDRRY